MENNFKKQCKALGINLVYTRNKYTMLSSAIVSGVPTLRINRLLENCENSTSNAIIAYYTSEFTHEYNYKIIETYLKKLVPLLSFKIVPPNKLFIELIQDKFHLELTEVEITSICLKNFLNKEIKNIILVENNDILELDICINPSNT